MRKTNFHVSELKSRRLVAARSLSDVNLHLKEGLFFYYSFLIKRTKSVSDNLYTLGSVSEAPPGPFISFFVEVDVVIEHKMQKQHLVRWDLKKIKKQEKKSNAETTRGLTLWSECYFLRL